MSTLYIITIVLFDFGKFFSKVTAVANLQLLEYMSALNRKLRHMLMVNVARFLKKANSLPFPKGSRLEDKRKVL